MDLPGHGALADGRSRWAGGRRAGAAVIEVAGRRTRRGRRPVARRLRRDGPRRRDRPAGPRPRPVRGDRRAGRPVGACRIWPSPGRSTGSRRRSGWTATRRFFRRATRRPSPIRSSAAASGRVARATARPGRRAFRPRLAAYPGPDLIVNGEYDLPSGSARGVRGGARDVRRVRLRGAMHLANLDRPRPSRRRSAVRRWPRVSGPPGAGGPVVDWPDPPDPPP